MRSRALISALCTLTVTAVAPLAAAQTESELASRRVLLDQAQQARDAGDHARAVDLASRAGRIRMSPSVRLFLATEQERLGQLAIALGSADACVVETERDAAIPNRDAILAECRGLVSSLRSRIGTVTVHVPTPSPAGLQVRIGGSPLSDALYGAPYVVSPGTVLVEATAASGGRFSQSVEVPPAGGVDVTIDLQAPGGGRVQTTYGTVDAAVGATPRTGTRSGGAGVAPWIVVGAGGLVLGSSALFFALRNDAVSGCSPDGAQLACPSDAAFARAQDGPTLNALTNVALVAGPALIAGGLVWFFVANSSGGRPQHAATTPPAMLGVAPHGDGLVVSLHGAM